MLENKGLLRSECFENFQASRMWNLFRKINCWILCICASFSKKKSCHYIYLNSMKTCGFFNCTHLINLEKHGCMIFFELDTLNCIKELCL